MDKAAELAPVRPPRKRASKPKTRSGCLICKARRIKCDEGKPSCGNCLRSRRQCLFPPAPQDVFLRYKPIAPKDLANIAIVKPPNAGWFATEQESRYFQIFKEKTAASISGYFSENLWSRTVLQTCETNPAIRSCIIAIGALDQTMDVTQRALANNSHDMDNDGRHVFHLGNSHHQFALRQYGRALKLMQNSLKSKEADLRSALIACMLTVCFEALNGDMPAAITQVRSGLRLIKSYSPNVSPISARLYGADETHEIIQFFDRMDNDSVVTLDAEPIDLTKEIGPTTPDEAIEKLPPVFETIQEAKAYFEYFLKEFLHWIAYQLAWASSQKDETKRRAGVGKSNADMPFVTQRGIYLEAFNSWYRSFDPLLQSSLKDGNSSTVQASALAMACRFKSLDATLRVNHFLGEMGYDEIRGEFKAVMDLIHTLASYELRTRSATFAVEGAIISSAYGVALKCRDREIRRDAIQVMESRPRREGIFDNALQAKLARLQMEIEESGIAEDQVIPEENRIRGIKTTYDMIKRKGRMKYLKKDPFTGAFTYQHLSFTW